MKLATKGRQASLRLLVLFLACWLPAYAGWRLAGPFGGSARAIAVDPHNRNTLLAGARDSLLFRSDDAASSWRLLPFPAATPGVFNALIIDPAESGHIYAALDAGDSGDSGVYESRDGGQHWRELAGLRGSRIESLAMAPGHPEVLAAGTGRGVFLTSDGGRTWRRISQQDNPEMQDITALAIDPVNPAIIYAGTPHLPWKTGDSGASWHSIQTGLIDDSDIFSIRIDPSRPRRVLASACSGIYRSEDAGESWTKLRGIPGTHRRTHIIAEDPRDAGTIYAGTTLGLFKSRDSGRSWEHLNTEQVNWMVFDPEDPQVLYLATEHAGVLKSSDSGRTFESRNRGFANHRLTEITGAGPRLYASSNYEGRYGGVFTSSNGGLDWSLLANQEALLGRNLNGLVAVPSKNGLLFAASEDGILKSVDSGKTWSPLAIQPRVARGRPVKHFQRLRVLSLKAVQLDKPVLFAGTQAGLYRSPDSGLGWEAVASGGITGQPVQAIYAPARGAAWLAVRTAGGLFVSENAGRSWNPAPLPETADYLYDLALPAEHEAPLLAATSRGLLRSEDGGAHWTLITSGLPAATVNSVRFHPDHKREAFLVQYGRIYRSTDGGLTWQPFPSDGLENAFIRTLWFAPDIPGRIFALSAARGALVFELAEPVAAKNTTSITSTNTHTPQEEK